tara:strand:+ start:70207 stop:70992 length:786 start_codon:yes stop_codon:yes gene_type:complete
VLSQTYQELEVIIVDDGSNDGTKEYFEKEPFDPRVKYFYKANEGHPSLSRNYGAEYSGGEFLAFLDSDDEWERDKLKLQIDILMEDQAIAFVYTQATSQSGQQVSGYWFVKSGQVTIPLMFRNFIVTSSVLMKKTDFDKLGGFPIDPSLTIAEDLKLWLKLSALGRGCYLKKSLVRYDVGAGISSNVVKKFECLRDVLEWAVNQYKINPLVSELVIMFYWLRRYLQSRNDVCLMLNFTSEVRSADTNFLVSNLVKWLVENE